jgi:hypothetical protein
VCGLWEKDNIAGSSFLQYLQAHACIDSGIAVQLIRVCTLQHKHQSASKAAAKCTSNIGTDATSITASNGCWLNRSMCPSPAHLP